MSTVPPLLPPQGTPPSIAAQSASTVRQKGKTPLLIFVLAGFLLLVVFVGGIGIGLYLTARSASEPVKVTAIRDPELESTLRSMEVAAKMGDWKAFSRHVDVSALRSSIHQLFRDTLAEERKKGEIGNLEAFLGDLLAGLALENYLTEENLPQIMSFFALAIAFADDGKKQADPDVRRYSYFASSDVFVMAVENAKEKDAGYFVFRKDPLAGWRLAGVTDKKP